MKNLNLIAPIISGVAFICAMMIPSLSAAHHVPGLNHTDARPGRNDPATLSGTKLEKPLVHVFFTPDPPHVPDPVVKVCLGYIVKDPVTGVENSWVDCK